MGYPLIDEFCRVPGLESCQPSFFRRCQREFREVVQPMLDEREALILKVAALDAELHELKAKSMGGRRRAEVSA